MKPTYVAIFFVKKHVYVSQGHQYDFLKEIIGLLRDILMVNSLPFI